MLSNVQLFITEIGCDCNLAKEHAACPVNKRNRTGTPLTDEKATALILQAYREFNFRGYVAFHWYNEPMLEWRRIGTIVAIVRKLVPHSKFLLWTNGTIQPDDPDVPRFDAVKVTDYHKRASLTAYYLKWTDNVGVIHWNFDTRIRDWRDNEEDHRRCSRPDIECVIDNFGEMRLCCQDWRGYVPIGNVWVDTLDTLLNRRADIVATIQRRRMTEDTPERCRRCHSRSIRPLRII